MTGERRFRGVLAESGEGGGRWVEVPFDAREAFGQSRPPVRGEVNGVPFRSRLAVYGGVTYLGLRSQVREAAKLEVGDAVEVSLALDEAPREVDVPEALAAALADDAMARAAFDALAFTHRREFAEWVAQAKREDTRARRAAGTLKQLKAGTVRS